MSNVKQLISDVTELAELQCRLIADDVRSSLSGTIKPTVLVVLSMALLVGTIPVLLLASASFLMAQQQWSPQLAQFACSGASLLIAVIMGSFAIQRYKQCASPLQRSLDEFEKNMATLREMLVGKEKSATGHNGSRREHHD